MEKLYQKKQQGFSFLSVILIVVVVVVAIGGWAFSGQGTFNSSGNINPSIQASAIINEGNSVKTEFDRLVLKGSSPRSIVFIPNVASTITAPNILDTVGGITTPQVNKNIIRVGAAVPEGIWVYSSSNFNINKATAYGGSDQVIMLAGVKDTVCKSINKAIHNNELIPSVTTKANSAAFVTGATVNAPTTSVVTDLSAVTALNGWTSGCISANNVRDNNLYFMVLKPGLCGPAPAGTRTTSCPTGQTGSYTQTQTYSSAPAPTCWNSSGWAPATPPSGACANCTPAGTYAGGWCDGADAYDDYHDGNCGYYSEYAGPCF